MSWTSTTADLVYLHHSRSKVLNENCLGINDVKLPGHSVLFCWVCTNQTSCTLNVDGGTKYFKLLSWPALNPMIAEGCTLFNRGASAVHNCK